MLVRPWSRTDDMTKDEFGKFMLGANMLVRPL